MNKLDKCTLEEEYLINKLSSREIAKKYKKDQKTVLNKLHLFGIPIRNQINDLSNQVIGGLTVLCIDKKGYDNCYWWKCRCECGNYELVSSYKLLNKLKKCCKKCIRNKNANLLFTGVGELSGKFIGQIKSGAKKRKIEFLLDGEYLWNLFLKQNKLCALSGAELSLGGLPGHRNEITASLDRINSSKGYVKENVQWVHKIVNLMKSDLDENTFINYCKRVANNDQKFDRRRDI